MNRRNFLQSTAAGLASVPLLAAAQSTQPAKPAEVTSARRLDPVLANEFITAAHGNLDKVKEMLAAEPADQKRLGGLIVAERELSLGDFETALGGAAHMARKDIADFLLAHGARIDALAAAMLGYREVIAALLKALPATAATRGPHGLSLLYHAAISGRVEIAQDIAPHLPKDAPDFNQALTAAARSGHLDMTRYLLANGVTNPNARDGIGNTALKYATQNNFTEVAAELRKSGAT